MIIFCDFGLLLSSRLLLSVPDRQQGPQEQLHLYLLPVWYAGHPAQHVTGAVGTDPGRAVLQHSQNKGTVRYIFIITL